MNPDTHSESTFPSDAAPALLERHELERDEAVNHLASVGVGRVGFTRNGQPCIVRAHHVLDGEQVIFRPYGGEAFAHTAGPEDEGILVAYQADAIDPLSHRGWSVTVTGYARRIDEAELPTSSRRHFGPAAAADTQDLASLSLAAVRGFQLG